MIPDVTGCSLVIVVIVFKIVLVDVTRAIGMDVKSAHGYASTRSIDTTTSSSPLTSLTSNPSH
jgi:hypothetical protein